KLKEEGINGVGIHKGICVDSMPGSEVFEVRYVLSLDLLDENGMDFSEPNAPVRHGEVVLKFAFKFKDGKVTEIKKTRNYLAISPRECDIDFNNN
ncbi:MAG: hypothetical protein P8O83_00540, partial [Flavobacteriaceae bacterium]|nr:hypothetical protein [Flavobacteriaceae bacterium]